MLLEHHGSPPFRILLDSFPSEEEELWFLDLAQRYHTDALSTKESKDPST